MRRRSRTRRVLKWTGTAICLTIVAVFLVSMWWEIKCGGQQKSVIISDGSLRMIVAPFHLVSGVPFGWSIAPNIPNAHKRIDWWCRFRQFRGVVLIRPVTETFISVPLWMPFVLVGTPTTYLWLRGRRRISPGHCQHCGYDLTGNVSGRCPECGTTIDWR